MCFLFFEFPGVDVVAASSTRRWIGKLTRGRIVYLGYYAI
jgi:hypothetical protein